MANLTEKQIEQYASLIAKRIESMEGQWERPWIESPTAPQNMDGRHYSRNGLNSMMLSLDASINGYTHPVYTTFLRAKEEGVRINAGEKGILVSFMGHHITNKYDGTKITPADYKELPQEEQDKYKFVPFLRVSPVFNLDQTNIKESRLDLWEKIDQRMHEEATSIKHDNSFVHPALDHVIDGNNWIIPITHSQESRAYYSPDRQLIHLPNRELFLDNEGYYATALHEMAHSTERPLKRDITNYAREELVAELSASIASNNYDYPKHIQDNNVQYIKSWLQSMKESPDFLKEILEDVQKVSNFLVKEIDERYSQSLNPEEKVIAAINYYPGKGLVETVEFKNEEAFLAALTDAYDNRGYDGVTYQVFAPNQELADRIKEIKKNFFPVDEFKLADLPHETRPTTTNSLEQTIADKELEDEGLFNMYANPNLMTVSYLEAHKINDPTLHSLIKEREALLEASPLNDDSSLLIQREQLEDKIRLVAGELYSLPSFPSHTQKKEYITSYIETATQGHLSVNDRIVHDATYSDISVVIREQYSSSKIEKLERDGVDFQVLGDTIQFEARIRYREGFTLPSTPENKELLTTLQIPYTLHSDDRVFISSTEGNLGQLTYHTEQLQTIYGIGLLPKLTETSLQARLSAHSNLTPEERQSLVAGLTIIKGNDSSSMAYYIDSHLNQLRSISSKDIFIPKELSGHTLSPEQRHHLQFGKEISFFDKENHVYHRAQLDLTEHNNLRLEYRTSLSEPYRTTPTINSSDHEKEQYIAIKGARGIDDIWGREGVKLERESFLDRYQVQQHYREYLRLKSLGEPGTSQKESEQIKQLFQRNNNSLSLSR